MCQCSHALGGALCLSVLVDMLAGHMRTIPGPIDLAHATSLTSQKEKDAAQGMLLLSLLTCSCNSSC